MHWRHYLLLTKKTVHMMTDHDNLKYFLSTKKLNGRQARGTAYLSPWDIKTLSRRPNHGDVKSGTADAAMLPVPQNLIRDQESESECSAREARESGSLI